MTPVEERKKRLELIKLKYKKGVPKLVIDELADKCAREFVREKEGVRYENGRFRKLSKHQNAR